MDNMASLLDLFRKKRSSVPETMAAIGLKKALVIGMLSSKESEESDEILPQSSESTDSRMSSDESTGIPSVLPQMPTPASSSESSIQSIKRTPETFKPEVKSGNSPPIKLNSSLTSEEEEYDQDNTVQAKESKKSFRKKRSITFSDDNRRRIPESRLLQVPSTKHEFRRNSADDGYRREMTPELEKRRNSASTMPHDRCNVGQQGQEGHYGCLPPWFYPHYQYCYHSWTHPPTYHHLHPHIPVQIPSPHAGVVRYSHFQSDSFHQTSLPTSFDMVSSFRPSSKKLVRQMSFDEKTSSSNSSLEKGGLFQPHQNNTKFLSVPPSTNGECPVTDL